MDDCNSIPDKSTDFHLRKPALTAPGFEPNQIIISSVTLLSPRLRFPESELDFMSLSHAEAEKV
jgi:hypothetical protein